MKPVYVIIECRSPDALADAVNEAISNDYTPVGGVAVSVRHVQDRNENYIPEFYYTQAMVLSSYSH